jgi:hypothetical protein
MVHGEHGSLQRSCFWTINFQKLPISRAISFHPFCLSMEKIKLKYDLNLGLLGCNGDFNHYINLFLFKIM